MSSETVAKSVGKKLRYYFEVKRLEDGFDLSGVNSPQLDHPPLKARPTLQYDGLHDRSLKHYFSMPEVRQKITKMMPHGNGELREDQIKKILHAYMYKYRFVHPTMPEWMYKNHPKYGKKLRPEFVGFGVPLQSQKTKSFKGGWPLLRSVPGQTVSNGEAGRLIDVATRILVATETVDRKQSRPHSSASMRQTAPKPFETSKPLPGSVHQSAAGSLVQKSTNRPSTAKYTWDIQGRRQRKVKACDDSYVPDWINKQPESPPKPRPKTPERKQPSPRQVSPGPSYRPRTVINVPEPSQREDVGVNSGTQTSDNTVGLQTEKQLLEEYDHTEDEVKDGPWAEYQIYVRTGDTVGASTKADVKISLYGEKGRTKEFQLGDSSRYKVKFQRGKEDVFLLAAHHVGKILKIKIGHDHHEMRYSWFLDGVSVYDMYDKRIYDCTYHGWISGQKSKNLDGKTFKYLTVERDRAFVEAYDDVKSGEDYKFGKDRRNKDETSTESKASKDDKRSQKSTDGSKPDNDSDTESFSSSSSSFSSDSTASSASSNSGRKRSHKVSKSSPARNTPSPKLLSPVPPPRKDDFFDKKGPTFSFPKGDGSKPEEDYLSGYKAGLDAAASDRKMKEHDEDTEKKTVLRGQTIHDAARVGNLERMQELLHYYPEMKEAKDETGMTPLHVAVQQGRLEIVKWLAASNINLNMETPTGYSALHLAAMQGHVNCIIVLAAMGAALTCRSVDRQTPLHLAAMNGHIECVKWLIANRASLDAEDSLGRTPLSLGEEYKHKEVASFIKKCLEESHNPNSSFYVLRTSKKGELETIDEGNQSDVSLNRMWPNDTKTNSTRTEAGSRLDARKSPSRSADSNLQEKRKIYNDQHTRMEQKGRTFLDEIRDETKY